MGFLDRFRSKTTEVVDEHGEQIGDGLDKAAEVVDDKTGGRLDEHLDTGVDAVKDGLDSLDGKNDDIADEAPPAEAAGESRTPPAP